MDKKLFPIFFLVLVLALLIASCGRNNQYVCEGCEEKSALIDEKMEKYYDLSTGNLIEDFHRYINPEEKTEIIDSIDCYIDMSNGMSVPFIEDRNTRTLFADLRNCLPKNKTNYLSVSGAVENQEIQRLPDRNIDSYLANPSNFSEKYSPLDSAIIRIVNHPNRQSIFVTDGELARRKDKWKKKNGGFTSINPEEAWAREEFKKWMNQGNEIDFIIMSFKPGYHKAHVDTMRLFFIFFTPKQLALSGKNQCRRFLESTKNANHLDYTHLNFSRNAYNLQRNPESNRRFEEVGLNMAYIGEFDGYFEMNLNKELNYQHIHLFKEKEDFNIFINNFIDGNLDKYMDAGEKNKFLYDLLITNEFVNYEILELGIGVKNITEDLENFLSYKRCMMSDTVILTDPETLEKDTVWCNPEFDCQDTSVCRFAFDTQNSRNVFQLHKSFMEGWQNVNGNKREGNIAIKPFDAEKFDYDAFAEMTHFKVDVMITDASYKEQADFALLKWRDKQFLNPEMRGLFYSMKYAMENLKPKNQVIFSYYFTFDE